jgi:hypothetical protein
MARNAFMLLIVTVFVIGSAATPSTAASDSGGKGKSCRMEQQCRWENFKKICTWVKVCR